MAMAYIAAPENKIMKSLNGGQIFSCSFKFKSTYLFILFICYVLAFDVIQIVRHLFHISMLLMFSVDKIIHEIIHKNMNSM